MLNLYVLQEVLVSGMGGRAAMAADKLLKYLVQNVGWANRGVRYQNVLVLNRTKAPAILTENGFIDSVSNAAKLKDPSFIRALTVAHVKGICDYFGLYKGPSQTSLVSPPVTPAVDKTVQDINLMQQAINILRV